MALVLDDSAIGCVEGVGGGAVEIYDAVGLELELLRRRFGDLSLLSQMEVAGYRLEGRLGRPYSCFYGRDRCDAIGSFGRSFDFDYRQKVDWKYFFINKRRVFYNEEPIAQELLLVLY